MGDVWAPSKRLTDVAPSGIRVIFDRAAALENAGHRVVHFEIGRPDFDTPRHVKDAAADALAAGHVHYSSNWGIPPLREAIAQKLAHDNAVRYSPDDEVIVTVGANEAVLLAILATIDPGEEVVIPTPTWPHYAECVRLAGGHPVFVPLDPTDGYALRAEAVVAALTPRTRMVVVCSPNNPTGAVVAAEDLTTIAKRLSGTRILLLADDIYESLVYDDVRHTCAASIPDLRDRTLVVGGLAKSWAMDGWRLGWLAGPRELVRWALRVRQYTTVCPPTFLQYGAVAALRGDQEPRLAMRREFGQRRAAALRRLAGQDLLRVTRADGAFYLYARYDPHLPPAQQLALDLLERQHVAVVPGPSFGPGQDHAIRIAYSCSLSDVEEGLTRMLNYLSDLAPASAA
ncbi:pyridoxal phosphate-dependent aminotransferase [Phytohabitans suffuscus]|uniref:Aminotransferase n=1 Tax=Phytohabitans suffuscus TaxID=624315 RepID=A0A6F8YEX6_9ACTN|nr:pyridoxal phosphate-dependent aminotransferase [Phytohabitans suffuscus]BCB84528.1 aminotransferase [Phytohabitans suffuscus]